MASDIPLQRFVRPVEVPRVKRRSNSGSLERDEMADGAGSNQADEQIADSMGKKDRRLIKNEDDPRNKARLSVSSKDGSVWLSYRNPP